MRLNIDLEPEIDLRSVHPATDTPIFELHPVENDEDVFQSDTEHTEFLHDGLAQRASARAAQLLVGGVGGAA